MGGPQPFSFSSGPGQNEADLIDWKRGFADLFSEQRRWPAGRVPEGWHELDEGAELWAGQNPHLFWVEDVEVPPSGLISKFVAIAGGTYSEAIGGANLLNLADVYFLYVSEDGLRAERLETQGHQPDKMMGSASAWCPDREVLVVFGGGTVVASSDRTFVLRGVLQEL